MRYKIFFFILFFTSAFLFLWVKLFYLQIVKGEENKLLAQENRIRIEKIYASRGVIYDRNKEILVRNKPEGREYIYGEILAHVLGYIGEISEQELAGSSYQLGDIVGKTGIEKQYDELLRGKDGGIIVETNASGDIIREIKKQEPKNGESLNLTLDLELQKKVLKVMEGRKGAIVVSVPGTGEVLALVSSPSFDPNLFTLKAPRKTPGVDQVLSDSDQPMFNRAISGLYPPGSIFKIVTAIAALEEGKIDRSTLIEDTGEIKIEKYGREYIYANWYYTQYGQKEGMLDIVKAIKRSNDIFFYKTGEWLGIKRLTDWARYFGLGQLLGIDLPDEADGLVPTPEWKKEQKTESWYLGDTYITSIGQGNLLLTPLQVHQMTSVIASADHNSQDSERDNYSQGKNSQRDKNTSPKLCQPHLIKGKLPYSVRGRAPSKINLCQELNIKPENLELIKEGMKQACEEKGTAPIFAGFSPQVGCKTGTAEFGDPQERTHAWFTVFAPWEEPEILVTVLLEEAGEGSKEAAPVAKKILEYWFERK